MPESPLFIALVVLLVLCLTIALMSVFGFADRLMFFLQLAFVGAAALAVWAAFTHHAMTEYAVWAMYATGVMLAVLMVRRSLRRKKLASEFQDSQIV